MIEYVEAWQCIGCGKIEAPQPCIGVCKDRKVKFVDAAAYEDSLVQLAHANDCTRKVLQLVRRLAYTNPHRGQWEQSFRALQLEARRLLRATHD